MLLEMDELEKGALGNGCFWKRVLLEMDESKNGPLEKGALGKGCFEKKKERNERKLESRSPTGNESPFPMCGGRKSGDQKSGEQKSFSQKTLLKTCLVDNM